MSEGRMKSSCIKNVNAHKIASDVEESGEASMAKGE